MGNVVDYGKVIFRLLSCGDESYPHLTAYELKHHWSLIAGILCVAKMSLKSRLTPAFSDTRIRKSSFMFWPDHLYFVSLWFLLVCVGHTSGWASQIICLLNCFLSFWIRFFSFETFSIFVALSIIRLSILSDSRCLIFNRCSSCCLL